MHKYWERHPHTQLARSNSVSSLSNQHFSQWAKCAMMFIAALRGFQCAQTNCNPQPPPPPTPLQAAKKQAAAPCWHHWHTFTRRAWLFAARPIPGPGRSSNCDDDDDGNTCQRLLPGDRSVPVAVSITVRLLSSAAREQSGGVRPYGDFVEATDLGYDGAQIIIL